MNYPAFEVFGTQHLVTLLICALVIYAYPKYFANQNPAKQTQGGKILAGIMILHMVTCLLYTSPSPRDRTRSRMPSSA